MSTDLSRGDNLAYAARMPLPSSPAPEELRSQLPNDNEGGPSIYALYLKYAKENDSDTLSNWNADMDILLIFAALFSAIVTAFLIDSLSGLKEDYSEKSSALLTILVIQSLGQNSTTFTLPPPFQVDSSSVIITSLFTISVILSVSAALGAILSKQWLREYTARLSPIPSIRAFQRHRRHEAFKRWHIADLIALLPAMLHVAAALFFAALILYLRPVNQIVTIVASVMIGITAVTYLAFFALPFFTAAPFITPLTHLVREVMFNVIIDILLGMRTLLLSIISGCALCFCRIQTSTELWHLMGPGSRLIQRYRTIVPRVPDEKNIMEGERSHAELLSWLVHSPLADSDVEEVVRALSGIQGRDSRRMLEDNGVDVMLIHHLRSSCFRHGGVGYTATKAILERVPFAMSCLDVWFGILDAGIFTDAHHPSESEPIIGALLEVTDGLDNMRVLAASLWMFRSREENEYLEYRSRILSHLMNHIEGVRELPDDIIRILVDDPKPPPESLSTMIQLLRKYLDRVTLPSIDCIHTILLHMCNCLQGEYWAREFSTSRLIAILFEREVAQSQLLRLVRSLSSSDPTFFSDVHLAKSLISLLKQSQPPDSIALDVWKTISVAPEICHPSDRVLLDLAKMYQRQASWDLSQASITAIAAFTESIFRTRQYAARNLEKESLRTADIVAQSLIDSPSTRTNINILLPSLYTLSLVADLVDNNITACAHIPILIPHLTNILAVPNSGRQMALMQHTLRLIDQILFEDASRGTIVVQSQDILEQLAIFDDFWIRWLAFDILKSISYHIPRGGRRRIFKIIRDDIERRLNSSTHAPFIDRNWRDLTDAASWVSPANRLETPMIALAQEINADITCSGIRDLLEGAPNSMICKPSVYASDSRDFPWLYPFDSWIRDTQ